MRSMAGVKAMTAMLEMRNVSKSFSGVKALRDVNFSVEAGRDPRALSARTVPANPH